MIKILIVDDSQTETRIIKSMLESQEDMCVVGCARDGKEAVEMNARLKPDVITMDLEMPVMDGHTATRLIMAQNPIPIIIISSRLDDPMQDMTFLALDAGAVSVLAKPVDVSSAGIDKYKTKIIQTVRSMAEIKVVKRRFNTRGSIEQSHLLRESIHHASHKRGSFELVAIGTSIGGPQTLKHILSNLPQNFPVPIVIVQHMTKGFIDGYAQWLNEITNLKVKNVENNEILEKGKVYIAPDNYHFTVAREQNHLVAKLISGEPVAGFYPSITVLLRSVAKTCGPKALGVLLTGMGNDGADGLLEMKKAGAHTVIQDKNSCVVFGMAGVALSMGAVDKVIEIQEMPEYIASMTTAPHHMKF